MALVPPPLPPLRYHKINFILGPILHNVCKCPFYSNATASIHLEEESTEQQNLVLQHNNVPGTNHAHRTKLVRDYRVNEALGTSERGAGFEPETYVSLLQACEHRNALEEGKQVHAHMVVNGFVQNTFLRTKIVSMYANCGSMVHARHMFDRMPKRNVFLWNTMIRGYAGNGFCEDALEFYYWMQRAGLQPDKFTYPIVLKVCARVEDLQQGKDVHSCIARSEFQSDVYVGNALVAMYAKCSSIADARQVFDKMSQRDVISWNSIIAGYAQSGICDEALRLFRQMLLSGMKPDSITMACILLACARLAYLQQGKEIHTYTIKNGLQPQGLVANALIGMYFKCSRIEDAGKLFDEMVQRDVVSWNAMIAGYAQNGYCDHALRFFCEMQWAGVKAESVTITSVLPACAHLKALRQGREIHSCIVRYGFQLDVYVGNALIDMYVKCGRMDNARQVFDKMSQRDVVSLTAMITGYNQNGLCEKALILFQQMKSMCIKPDSVTIASVLPACTNLAALQRGKEMHGYIFRHGLDSDVFVGNALIDMYAKCGSIENAHQQFDKMSHRDVVSWSALIAGYGMHGRGDDALTLFYQMQLSGMKPDYITFVAVLSACSHAGLMDEGLHYFDSMSQDYHITPGLEHYTCVVDILGRAGCLDEAHDFIKRMPFEPTPGVWGALLGACRIHRNIKLGESVAEHLLDLEPENAGYYVLLSNLYAVSCRWDDAAKVRTMMKDRGLKKAPGCSWIEVQKRVHAFIVGDTSHPQSKNIYAILESLAGQMEKAGYVADTNFVLHELEE